MKNKMRCLGCGMAGEVGEQRDDGEFEEGSHAGSLDMIFLF